MWQYPFARNSLFPHLSLNDILEVEFQFGLAMGISPSFNDWEFFELIWKFERMVEQRKKENEEAQKSQNGRVSMMDIWGKK